MQTMVTRMGAINLLNGYVQVNVFYEPSTRTNCSFQAAMLRLGGEVMNVDANTSSVTKGETLKDTSMFELTSGLGCARKPWWLVRLRHCVASLCVSTSCLLSRPRVQTNASHG